MIVKVIRKEKKIPGDLNFIFTGDDEILKINREFLEHNYFTDVIAFGYGLGRRITGEIYISIDTVRSNSNNYKISLKEEVKRVIIHGTLHLCGYNDSTKLEKEEMRNLENYWLENWNKR